ncbi:MAG: hypothetical protein KGS61_10805 [Verrucomicrobia bacterium]|nr:hypothetical protein [Verrucomicrobiota bacterium]
MLEAVTEREAYKRALVLESELNRFALRLECANLRVVAARFGQATRLDRRLGPASLVLAAAGGLLLAGRVARSRGRSNRWLTLLKSLLTLYGVWRDLGPSPGRAERPTPAAEHAGP